LEERQLNVTQLDIFSRLMMDRILFFGTEVNADTANIAVSQLLYLDNLEPGSDITMYINSPGGEVYSGYSILDTMDFIESPVATTCTGMAASMGALLLMCGEKGKRSALKHSRVMIHQPLGGCSGQASDIEIEAKEILKLRKEINDLIVSKTGQTLDIVEKDTDRDHWLTADEAKNYGIIDEVVLKK
jgi:ATP-dependent Clp protease protease subunit